MRICRCRATAASRPTSTATARPDLVVTTTTGVELLWNNGNGTFTEGARCRASGWYTGAAVADVNGDGRPDIFVAGYADPNEPVPGSLAGFPTNIAGVRDLLFLNEGRRTAFREVGVAGGPRGRAAAATGSAPSSLDYNGDGRPDLYVANDEDPNQLYENVAWPAARRPIRLGSASASRSAARPRAWPIRLRAWASRRRRRRPSNLFVTNSRHEPSAAYRADGRARPHSRTRGRPSIRRSAALSPAGARPGSTSRTPATRRSCSRRARSRSRASRTTRSPCACSGPSAGRSALRRRPRCLGSDGLRLNGRGLAAADAGNDGRMDVAINTIGGKLVLLAPHGPERALARREARAVLARRRRHRVLPDGRRLSRAGAGRAAATSPRRIRASTSASGRRRGSAR